MEHRRNINRNVDEDITFRRVRESNVRAFRQTFPIFLPPFIGKRTFRVSVSCNIRGRYSVIHCVVQPSDCDCTQNNDNLCTVQVKAGHTVAQLVEALRYKSEGHGFDSLWCHWNFSLT
jgi:hypothetical protein